ncbi:MAG: glycosyltransferase family 4 protein [Thermomicrobia bacterium]|nr:glycosyltransferase family 4 protein [Thermomicrobia bacterium]
MYPQITKLTGAQRLILQLARYTVAAGHRVTLVTHRLGDEPRAAMPPGLAVIETGRRVDWFAHHYADAALEYAFGPLLVQHIPNGVEALVCFGPPALPALWWARRRGWGAPTRPLLAFLYEPPRFVDRDRADVVAGLGRIGRLVQPLFGVYARLDRLFAQAADMLLANGAYGGSRLAEVYGRAAVVVPHGVDFRAADDESVAMMRARYGFPADAPVILTVNQLHPRKRIDLFIRVVAAVHTTHPAVIGLIVGRGVDEARLRAEAARCGVTEAIRFAGFVADDDLPALYRSAAAYLHTGRDETFGLSVLEAAWSAVPVVTVDEGGPPDIVRENGWIVPTTVAMIVDALNDVLANPSAAKARAARARADVRARFRWEEGADALIQAAEGLRGGS